MNLILSIFRREMIALPRRRRFYLKRTMLVLLGGIIIIWGLSISRGARSTTMGLQIFSTLSITMLVAVSSLFCGAHLYTQVLGNERTKRLRADPATFLRQCD